MGVPPAVPVGVGTLPGVPAGIVTSPGEPARRAASCGGPTDAALGPIASVSTTQSIALEPSRDVSTAQPARSTGPASGLDCATGTLAPQADGASGSQSRMPTVPSGAGYSMPLAPSARSSGLNGAIGTPVDGAEGNDEDPGAALEPSRDVSTAQPARCTGPASGLDCATGTLAPQAIGASGSQSRMPTVPSAEGYSMPLAPSARSSRLNGAIGTSAGAEGSDGELGVALEDPADRTSAPTGRPTEPGSRAASARRAAWARVRAVPH